MRSTQMNWNKGFSARYYLSVVDPGTWRSMETSQLISGSVIRSEKKMIESATVELTDLPEESEPWIRIWMDARQEGSGGHAAIFTGLLQTPDTDWNGKLMTLRAECCSVLKPADDILMARGYYVPAGVEAAAFAAQLLQAGPAPVEYTENGPNLTESIIAERGETRLTMAQKVIDAIGWRIRIAGDGVITICPKALTASASYDPSENDAVETVLRDRRDWYDCPNVFRAVSGDLTAVARDDSPDSPLSTVSRGREVWKEDLGCRLGNAESIADYAARRLKEEQEHGRDLSYTRRFDPDLTVGDLVSLRYPAQNIDGLFRITSQNIELIHGGRTAEEVEAID